MIEICVPGREELRSSSVACDRHAAAVVLCVVVQEEVVMGLEGPAITRRCHLKAPVRQVQARPGASRVALMRVRGLVGREAARNTAGATNDVRSGDKPLAAGGR